MLRQGTVVVLSVLLATPFWGGTAPIGFIELGQKTNISGLAAPKGTTVFDGDTITVNATGSAAVVLRGGSRVLMAASSEARLLQHGQQLEIQLASGEVELDSSSRIPVKTSVADVTFRPAAPGIDSAGFLNFKNQSQLTFYAVKGNWIVEPGSGRPNVILPAGHEFNGKMSTLGAGTSGQAAQGNQNRKKRWRLAAFWIGLPAVGVATGLGLAFGMSECTAGRPGGCPGQPVVSPVVP